MFPKSNHLHICFVWCRHDGHSGETFRPCKKVLISLLIQQASVNYSTIAEKLSGYIAELSESIAVCTQWLDLYDNPAMQARLSDIYTQYFHFFIKVATWYMKPKPSKWLDSFNSNFTTGYEDTTETIKRSILLIRDQALVENAWQLNRLDQSFTSFEKRLFAWVNEIRNEKNEAGGTMTTLMLQMTERSTQRLLIPKTHLDNLLILLGYF